MSYFDNLYPEDEKEFACNICDKAIDEPGVCSEKCWQINNL